MLSLHLMSQRLPSALTLVLLGAPLIGCGVSAAAEDISQKMVQLDTSSNLAVKPMPYRNPHRNPKKQFAAITAAVGGVLLLAGLAIGVKSLLLYAVLFGIILVLLAAVDIKSGYLPDMLTVPLLLAGLGVNFFHFFTSFTDAVLGAAGGLFMIIGSNRLHSSLTGEGGFGLGDAKMLAAIGAWLGTTGVVSVTFVALPGPLLIWLLHAARNRHARIPCEMPPAPFGPWLAAAGVLALLISSMHC